MKAIAYSRYGSPVVLQLKEVDVPTPGPKEVLVEVHATSLNASDHEFLTGSPAYVRAWGWSKPKHPILGSDIAGRVVEVGSDVGRFQPGDAVFGDILYRWGGFAEYACAPEEALTMKPQGLTYEEAAALPQAGLVALQGLRHGAGVQPGQQVLINGGGGGTGTFAIQIARASGAEVTAVDSTSKLELMQALGADEVVDYQREDFTKRRSRYDLILDFVASHPLRAYRAALAPGGKYLMVGGSVPHLLRTVLLGPMLSLAGSRKVGMLFAKPNERVEELLGMIDAGQVRPVIGERYALDEVPEALRRLGAGHSHGKSIIVIRGEKSNQRKGGPAT